MNKWWTGKSIHWTLVAALAVSAVCPAAARAQAAGAKTSAAEAVPKRIPVRLDEKQMLRGLARDSQGELAVGTGVVVGRQGKPLLRTETDQAGQFAIGPLKPGNYEIASPDAAAFLQVEPSSSDPHQSAPTVELSHQAMIARGQEPRRTLLHAALIALVVAAAVAIPIAIVANDDDDAS